MPYYPFVSEPITEEQLKETRPFKAYQLLCDKGGYKHLNEDERKEVNVFFSEMWHRDAYYTGQYKILGWIIDFSNFLNDYLVNLKFYGWTEVKSFNKTCIRKNSVSPSYILEIIDR